MKVDKLSIGATIPTTQYGNIQPAIELSDVEVDEGTAIAMKWINGLYGKYSEKGALKENDLVINGVAQKTSFNEGKLIGFEPIAHTYECEGKKLVSATEYIKKFYKEFDAESISKASAKAWEVDQQQVKDLWESNGDLTSSFGTVVHKALEHYDKFFVVGNNISAKKELQENYAMPKHPILKGIVEGFQAIDKVAGKIIPEALITDVEGGYCGHADRIVILDEKLKICRIQDYKVNINSEEISASNKVGEPFKNLPANKISKYQLQMSFYANMLQKSGWTVEGLDVFIYEDEWLHYKLEVLDVLPKVEPKE